MRWLLVSRGRNPSNFVSNNMPFTGFSLWLLVLAGVALIAFALTLRRVGQATV